MTGYLFLCLFSQFHRYYCLELHADIESDLDHHVDTKKIMWIFSFFS